MGWWQEQRGNDSLAVGDEPVDIAEDAIDGILAAYSSELGRPAAIREVARTLEIAMNSRMAAVTDEASDKDIELTARTRRRPRTVKLKRGDYFAVPLPGGGYGYGRITGIYSVSILLVEFLTERSDHVLRLADVLRADVLFEASCSYRALADRQWPILGNVPLTSTQKSYEDAHRDHWRTECSRSAGQLLEWRLDGKSGMPWPDPEG